MSDLQKDSESMNIATRSKSNKVMTREINLDDVNWTKDKMKCKIAFKEVVNSLEGSNWFDEQTFVTGIGRLRDLINHVNPSITERVQIFDSNFTNSYNTCKDQIARNYVFDNVNKISDPSMIIMIIHTRAHWQIQWIVFSDEATEWNFYCSKHYTRKKRETDFIYHLLRQYCPDKNLPSVCNRILGPYQGNGFDCGPFVIMALLHILFGRQIDQWLFTDQDMLFVRQIMKALYTKNDKLFKEILKKWTGPGGNLIKNASNIQMIKYEESERCLSKSKEDWVNEDFGKEAITLHSNRSIEGYQVSTNLHADPNTDQTSKQMQGRLESQHQLQDFEDQNGDHLDDQRGKGTTIESKSKVKVNLPKHSEVDRLNTIETRSSKKTFSLGRFYEPTLKNVDKSVLLAKYVKKAKRVLFLSGAGISVNSGIPVRLYNNK